MHLSTSVVHLASLSLISTPRMDGIVLPTSLSRAKISWRLSYVFFKHQSSRCTLLLLNGNQYRRYGCKIWSPQNQLPPSLALGHGCELLWEVAMDWSVSMTLFYHAGGCGFQSWHYARVGIPGSLVVGWYYLYKFHGYYGSSRDIIRGYEFQGHSS